MPHGKTAVQELRAHRIAREDKVLRCLSSGGGEARLDELTAAVYDDVPTERHPWARLTLEAHLIKLAREGRVVERGGVWRVLRR